MSASFPCPSGTDHPFTYVNSDHNLTQDPANNPCTICYRPLDNTRCQVTLHCTARHSFCAECLDGWIDAQVSSGHDASQPWPCPYCRVPALSFERNPVGPFTRAPVAELVQLMRRGEPVTIAGPAEFYFDDEAIGEPLYDAFVRLLRPLHVFHVTGPRRPGDAIWRGVDTIYPGALRIGDLDDPARDSRLRLLSAREMYEYVSDLNGLGWNPGTGQLSTRLDTAVLRNRPLDRILDTAIQRRVDHITQLDFEDLYPEERFVQSGRVPHITLVYVPRDGFIGLRVAIGTWRGDAPDEVFEGCSDSDAKDAVDALAQLGGGPALSPTHYPIMGSVEVEVRRRYANEYFLFENPPRREPHRVQRMGYRHVPG